MRRVLSLRLTVLLLLCLLSAQGWHHALAAEPQHDHEHGHDHSAALRLTQAIPRQEACQQVEAPVAATLAGFVLIEGAPVSPAPPHESQGAVQAPGEPPRPPRGPPSAS